MQQCSVLRCLAVMATLMSLVAAFIHVDPSTGRFIDSQGRTITFHGVNAVSKLPPFHPLPTGFDPLHSLSDMDAKNLSAWGFNVVRLGVLWEAVMPIPGQVNSTFLDQIETIVNILGKHNLYTILDMHQDAMGRRFCGEGVPDYITSMALEAVNFTNASGTQFPAPHAWEMDIDPATHFPARDRCSEHNFFDYYSTTESIAAWEGLWTTPALWDMYGDFWEAVASRFNTSESVLGYELINEPFSGVRGATDASKLGPLYRRLHDRIRLVDQEHIIFFESLVIQNQHGEWTDFSSGPGGSSYNDRQALAYHVYCFNTTNRLLLPVCDLAFDVAWFASMESVAKLGCGSFLTEFGAVDDGKMGIGELKQMLKRAEHHQQSWAYWTFKSFDDITTEGSPTGETFFNPDGSVQAAKLGVLSRPYAPVVAGLTKKASFDDQTSTFQLVYDVSDDIKSNKTVIFASPLHFSAGYDVKISPAGCAEVTKLPNNTLAVVHSRGQSTIKVVLTPS